ncbi:hypothetical protein BBJ29_003486 [Phytophthora kernoviae]|uniref:EF-hand domain-containing protein n=1 Tax=Phytophthora kernoviae TaxID=325452 RepID=A0A3F2S2A6_9STRA|nr:hypothetical protein BBJ29_003486 [Phytophthora kernoviae]RLN68768.1 hypothetical protein BBP00_00000798 [Phytophthora kernoviae]
MSRNDVRQLRRTFDEEDGAHSDTVTMRGFFHLIHDDKAFDRSQLVIKELLRLANITTEITRMTFDQYLCVVCTFAAFTESQLWNFIYEAYSAKGTGGTGSNRLGALLHSAGGSYTHNIEVATRHFAANAKSPQTGVPLLITFDEFLELVHRNPVVFFPVVQLQRTGKATTIGIQGVDCQCPALWKHSDGTCANLCAATIS